MYGALLWLPSNFLFACFTRDQFLFASFLKDGISLEILWETKKNNLYLYVVSKDSTKSEDSHMVSRIFPKENKYGKTWDG